MQTVTAAVALANALARGTAHHAHNGDRTVAFRVKADGRIETRYCDGVVHADLNPAEAQIMAECYLGEEFAPVATAADATPAKPTTPAKRASIALGRGWSISLRRDEVFPNDPGQGCPAVLCGPFGRSATYWRAMNEGEVDGPDGCEEIPAHIFRAAEKAEAQVAAYLEEVEAWIARRAA